MKKRTVIIIAVVAAIAAVALGIAIFVFAKLSLIKKADVKEEDIKVSDIYKDDTSEDSTEEKTNPYSGYEIIALVGIDTRDTSERGNGDTMILACLDHDEETIRLVSVYRDTYLDIGDKYSKACNAYASGGPEKFLTMINTNLDLNVTKFVTTNFNALADMIDELGGLDIEMTREELIHLNNYNVETSEVCGKEYEAVEVPDASVFDGAMTRTFHLTGTQAVSYARIRYTTGWDYKRTERQRNVLGLVKEKMKNASWTTTMSVIDKVFPQVYTNLSNTEILTLAQNVLSYEIIESEGFPFEKCSANLDGLDAIAADTLESNVIELHDLIYPEVAYKPSDIVVERSNYIAGRLQGAA